MSTRARRSLIAILGMVGLVLILAAAVAPIQMIGWMYLWLTGGVADAPGDYPDLAWLEWISYLIPIAIFLAMIPVVITWVRRAPAD